MTERNLHNSLKETPQDPTRRKAIGIGATLGLASLATGSFSQIAAAQQNEKPSSPARIAEAKSSLTTLNSGTKMPVLGLGTFNVPRSQAADVVRFGLQNGYRLVDTAKNYGNEVEIGQGIATSGVPRSEIFLTTKLWIEDYGHDQALRAFDESASKLGVEHLDLYLLHWPVPTDFNKTISAYKAVERLHAEGRIGAIGVSNFTPEHLHRLIEATGIVPAVNQIELHPYFTQRATVAENQKLGIKTESWSPIGGTFINNPKDPTAGVHLFEDPVIVGIARQRKRKIAQVILRWHIQHGYVAIPKSQHYERLLSNIELFDFELSDAEMAAIDSLNRDMRGGPEPEKFDIPAFKKLVARRGESIL